jgi:hypothetical protein
MLEISACFGGVVNLERWILVGLEWLKRAKISETRPKLHFQQVSASILIFNLYFGLSRFICLFAK